MPAAIVAATMTAIECNGTAARMPRSRRRERETTAIARSKRSRRRDLGQRRDREHHHRQRALRGEVHDAEEARDEGRHDGHEEARDITRPDANDATRNGTSVPGERMSRRGPKRRAANACRAVSGKRYESEREPAATTPARRTRSAAAPARASDEPAKSGATRTRAITTGLRRVPRTRCARAAELPSARSPADGGERNRDRGTHPRDHQRRNVRRPREQQRTRRRGDEPQLQRGRRPRRSGTRARRSSGDQRQRIGREDQRDPEMREPEALPVDLENARANCSRTS